jgi:hypothetical protein
MKFYLSPTPLLKGEGLFLLLHLLSGEGGWEGEVN